MNFLVLTNVNIVSVFQSSVSILVDFDCNKFNILILDCPPYLPKIRGAGEPGSSDGAPAADLGIRYILG